MANMDLGDVTIHYEEFGKGPRALVFCQSDHPMAGAEFGRFILNEMDRWQPHFGRTMVWEYRGLGESSRAAKYNLPLVASDLARMLDKMEIPSAVVYGYEFGGFVAQQFALDYPGKCAALVLDSTSPELNLAASEQYLKGAERHKEDPSIRPENLDFHVFASRAMAGMREHPFTPRLKYVTSPTLILAGAKDTATRGPAGSVIMSRQIPTNTLKIFEDGVHGLIHQRPREVEDLVVKFCREHGVI